jgi:hypothetical protein
VGAGAAGHHEVVRACKTGMRGKWLYRSAVAALRIRLARRRLHGTREAIHGREGDENKNAGREPALVGARAFVRAGIAMPSAGQQQASLLVAGASGRCGASESAV